ncbi:hypothetical protein BC629DRAFT_1215915 [Irpex lacteus]|nr:hypothetical protein BC629DRAFT_1215915 [Irpex lacteus]
MGSIESYSIQRPSDRLVWLPLGLDLHYDVKKSRARAFGCDGCTLGSNGTHHDIAVQCGPPYILIACLHGTRTVDLPLCIIHESPQLFAIRYPLVESYDFMYTVNNGCLYCAGSSISNDHISIIFTMTSTDGGVQVSGGTLEQTYKASFTYLCERRCLQ